MLICGEPSGDLLGAQLMRGLRQIAGDVFEFSGVGGPAMAAEGFRSLFSLDATSVMGLREIVPRVPEILRRIRVASNAIASARPDAAVFIDSPEFTHRVAKRVRRLAPQIPLVDYVAPQVWATRAYRAKHMARYFDLVLALLPFEVPFFETHNLAARFVGHPVVERARLIGGGERLRSRLAIAESAPVLLLLPGSRVSEVRPLLPVFRKTVAKLLDDIPEITCILPTLPHVSAEVQSLTQEWPAPLHILNAEADKFAAFAVADAALAASGTVTSELALANVPMVVAYKVGWLTSVIARRMIRVPYVTLVNLLLQRQAVPEFLQERCQADLIAPELLELLRDPSARERQMSDLRQAVDLLGSNEEAPSLRAARALLQFVQERRSAA